MIIRSMGLMVNHEHGLSARSMFSHVCAICGRLLYSRSDNSHLPREIEVPGPACQLRGRITDFFALPPFLLLWSKEALGRHLRSCLMYNNDKKKFDAPQGMGKCSVAPLETTPYGRGRHESVDVLHAVS